MPAAQWPARGAAVPTSHLPPPTATRHPPLPHTPLPCRKLLHGAWPWLPQDEGEEVSLELPPPAKGSAQLPFPSPPPLKAVLLDVELPMSLVSLLCLPGCIPDPLGMGLHPAHKTYGCVSWNRRGGQVGKLCRAVAASVQAACLVAPAAPLPAAPSPQQQPCSCTMHCRYAALGL